MRPLADVATARQHLEAELGLDPGARGVEVRRSVYDVIEPQASTFGTMIGALLLGFLAGAIGRLLMPGDVFRHMSGPTSWLVSLVLGLVGAAVGWLLFTKLLGIGDDDVFDLGGMLSAVIGVLIVLPIAGFILRRRDCPGTPARYRAAALASARSTTRATSTREDTPSLWNRLRRWVSTVFGSGRARRRSRRWCGGRRSGGRPGARAR